MFFKCISLKRRWLWHVWVCVVVGVREPKLKVSGSNYLERGARGPFSLDRTGANEETYPRS